MSSPATEKPGRLRVDVNDIRAWISLLAWFNGLDLGNVDLCEDGEPIGIPPWLLEEWHFVGLTNKDFVDMEVWKPENHRDLLRPGEPIPSGPSVLVADTIDVDGDGDSWM